MRRGMSSVSSHYFGRTGDATDMRLTLARWSIHDRPEMTAARGLVTVLQFG